MAMFMNKTKVLLILTQDVLDEARVLAGKATAALKLPVSLQIVLRALIEVGLKQEDRPVLLANIEDQAKAVRLQRSAAPRAGLRGNRPTSGLDLRRGGAERPEAAEAQNLRRAFQRRDEPERRGSIPDTRDDNQALRISVLARRRRCRNGRG